MKNLWTFIASTDYLPELMESMASVKDLNERFGKDENNSENHASPEDLSEEINS